MEGWIKWHRKLLENSIFKDAEVLAIWTWVCLNATHDTHEVKFNGKRRKLKSGQLTAGRKQIAAAFNIDESKVYRTLKKFEQEGMIKIQGSNKCSLITILSWDEYQSFEKLSRSCREVVEKSNIKTHNKVNNNNEAETLENIRLEASFK